MILYADSSFVTALYTSDQLSTEAFRLLRAFSTVPIISSATRLESANALSLQRFRGRLSTEECEDAKSAFEADIERGLFTFAPITARAWELASQLSNAHTHSLGTRSLDILHIATALDVGAEGFLPFDRRQRDLALAVGLNVMPA